jgi:fructokinase
MSDASTKIIVGLGEALWDMLPTGKHLGGAPLNFAYISSLLGSHAVIATRLGADALGDEIAKELSSRGIDTGFIQRDAALPTGTVQVTLSTDGQPEYEICRPVAWDAVEWSNQWRELAARADAVCFGSLAQRSDRSRSAIHEFLRHTRSDCVRIFDVNLRQHFYSPQIISDSLRLSTIVKMNDGEFEEISQMIGTDDAPVELQLQTFASKFDLKLVCVTRGAAGSILATRDRFAEHPGVHVEVRDTVGAGDAFSAAAVHSYMAGASLEEINASANRWAAWVASQSGGMPALDETQRKLMMATAC